MILLTNLIIILVLTCLITLFHEWGHRLALGDKFVRFSITPLTARTHGFMYKLTLFEWLYVTWNGFAFSSPIVLLSYFVLGSDWFFVTLLLACFGAALDFFHILLFFIIKHKEKAKFNQTIEELTHREGLKRWRF